jgi:ACS family sodium-dependent inorganic phosphate cotransporter
MTTCRSRINNVLLLTTFLMSANSFQSSSRISSFLHRQSITTSNVFVQRNIESCPYTSQTNHQNDQLRRPLFGRSRLRLFSQPPTKEAVEVMTYSKIDNRFQQQEESKSEIEMETPFSEFAPILALCWFVALLSALDRVAMSVAILPLSTEYHLTDTAKGAISSVFSIGYGLGIIPAGLLVASVSPRLVMAAGVTLWSLATFGTPIAANLVHLVQNADSMTNSEIATSIVYVAENTAPLLIMRSVMGAAESVVLPTIQRMLANWVPKSKKSLSIATVYSGFQIGTVCAYLLSPWVMDNVGWRGLFYVYGGVGALWLIPWWLLAKDSPQSALEMSGETASVTDGNSNILVKKLKEEISYFVVEQRLVDENGEEALGVAGSEITSWEEASALVKDAPWKDILTSKSTWGVTIAHAANNWGLYNMLSW